MKLFHTHVIPWENHENLIQLPVWELPHTSWFRMTDAVFRGKHVIFGPWFID